MRKIRSFDLIGQEDESLWDEDTYESTNGSDDGIPVICEYQMNTKVNDLKTKL